MKNSNNLGGISNTEFIPPKKWYIEHINFKIKDFYAINEIIFRPTHFYTKDDKIP